MLNSTPTGRPPTNDTEESLQNPHLVWDTPLLSILTAHPLHLVNNYTYFTCAYVHSVQQKSIGLKFSKSWTESHMMYSCHHKSSHFTFPILLHSWRFSVFHSWLKKEGGELPKAENWPGSDNTVINPELSGGRILLPFLSYSQQA